MSTATLEVDAGGFNGSLDAIAARVLEAGTAGIVAGAELVKTDAVAGAPIRSGHLRGSAEVRVFGAGGASPWARVRFPGPYARRQHFELSWRHPHGGHALYLYLAAATNGQAVIDLIGEKVRGAL